jgi:hypothetical protein
VKSLLTFLLIGVAVGVTIFAVLAKRATEFETVDELEAGRHFEKTREQALADISVSLERARPSAPPTQPTKIGLLLYVASEKRLVSAEVPFWFFRLKGDVIRLALEDSELDLKAHGATPKELARRGPGIVVDESRPSGDRYLLWLW